MGTEGSTVLPLRQLRRQSSRIRHQRFTLNKPLDNVLCVKYNYFMTKPTVARDKSDLVADLPMACANEDAAVAFIEAQRWGGHPVCPHCGVVDEARQIIGKNGERGPRYLWRCGACKKQFT